MLGEEKQIFSLYDEFYLIDDVKNLPVKEKEIYIDTNNEFIFTGANKTKTVFVYNDKNQLSDTDKLMLENLVNKGIGWKFEEVVLLNLFNNQFATIQNIKDFFKPSQIIFWGCENFLTTNKISIKFHSVLRGKEMNVLIANEISSYQTNEEKKLLWNSIQNLLDLK